MTITRDSLIVADLGADYAVCDSIITITGNDPTPGVALWTVESGNAVITNPTDAETEVIDEGKYFHLCQLQMAAVFRLIPLSLREIF